MSGNSMLASVLVGSIGFGFFVYGKKQRRIPHGVIGVVLMVYPYFVSSVALMFVIAAALIGLLYLATHFGM